MQLKELNYGKDHLHQTCGVYVGKFCADRPSTAEGLAQASWPKGGKKKPPLFGRRKPTFVRKSLMSSL